MWRMLPLAAVASGALLVGAQAQTPPAEGGAQPIILTLPTADKPPPADPQLPPAPTIIAPEPAPKLKVQTPKPKPAPKKEKLPGEMNPVDDTPSAALINEPGKPPAFRCFVRDVMAFYDRTHIRCYNKVKGKINFFAVDTAQPVAATLLTKGLAAMQAGKPLVITFAPTTDLNPSNCERANCRRLIDIRE